MTPQEIEDVGRYWQEKLGLANWKIEFPFGDALKKYWADSGDFSSSHAGCWRSKHYEEAKIYVNQDDYEGWSHAEGTQHIVHELVHLMTRDVEFILDMINESLPKDVMNIVEEVYIHHIERAIDNIANVFVKLGGSDNEPY